MTALAPARRRVHVVRPMSHRIINLLSVANGRPELLIVRVVPLVLFVA